MVIASTACVPKKSGSDSTPSDNNDDRIAALESKVSQLQSKIASLPASSGNYDKDIDNIYAELESFNEELDNILAEVDAMLEDWEESQDTNIDTNTDTTDATDSTDATTRWSLEAWTDYDSYPLLDIDLDSKKIEDEDDYTIWLLLFNKNHATIDKSGLAANRPINPIPADNYLYYETDGNHLLWQVQSGVWKSVSFSSIYSPVEIKEIIIQFSPKSSDRVTIDGSQTELYSTGYPSFDWDMDFSNRDDGTCKRMEATSEARFTIPVPTRFYDNDVLRPYSEQFELEFELAYK